MALAEFTVAFREFFEISLILGIMLAYLHKTGREKLAGAVWMGAALAGGASLVAAWAFESLAGGFEKWEPLFEGITLLTAAVLVTWLILWMFGQKNVQEGIKQGVKKSIADPDTGHEFNGLMAFAFIAVFREGIEIVLFLAGIQLVSGALSYLAIAVGAMVAIGLAWAVFRSLVHLNLSIFFKATGLILVLMAGGLVSQGIHELQEVGVIPTWMASVYNINPPTPEGGPYPLMHEKGLVGSMLRNTIGLDFNPSIEQLLAHVGYFVLVGAAYQRAQRQAKAAPN
jgi:high-affinity iron transporter